MQRSLFLVNDCGCFDEEEVQELENNILVTKFLSVTLIEKQDRITSILQTKPVTKSAIYQLIELILIF